MSAPSLMGVLKMACGPAVPEPLTTTHRFLVQQGFLYAVIGATFLVAPSLSNVLMFFDPPLSPAEEGMTRFCGVVVIMVGYLYWQGGKSNAEIFVVATLLDRLLLPAFLVPLIFVGTRWQLAVAFAALDPLLALLTYCRWARESAASKPCTILKMLNMACGPAVPGPLSATHRLIVLLAAGKAAAGTLLMVAPSLLLLDPPLSPAEDGMVRLLGLAVSVVGYFYWQSAKPNTEHFVAAAVLGHLLMPALCLPLLLVGARWQFAVGFAVVESLFALLTCASWQMSHNSASGYIQVCE